jgi:hypothetical protein
LPEQEPGSRFLITEDIVAKREKALKFESPKSKSA